jgi:hypothetical protein
MADAAFHETPEYDAAYARGIARELREEAKASWRAMHAARKQVAALSGDDLISREGRRYNELQALGQERQLRFLLGIRRAGFS